MQSQAVELSLDGGDDSWMPMSEREYAEAPETIQEFARVNGKITFPNGSVTSACTRPPAAAALTKRCFPLNVTARVVSTPSYPGASME